jgi:hypothetical protein
MFYCWVALGMFLSLQFITSCISSYTYISRSHPEQGYTARLTTFPNDLVAAIICNSDWHGLLYCKLSNWSQGYLRWLVKDITAIVSCFISSNILFSSSDRMLELITRPLEIVSRAIEIVHRAIEATDRVNKPETGRTLIFLFLFFRSLVPAISIYGTTCIQTMCFHAGIPTEHGGYNHVLDAPRFLARPLFFV